MWIVSLTSERLQVDGHTPVLRHLSVLLILVFGIALALIPNRATVTCERLGKTVGSCAIERIGPLRSETVEIDLRDVSVVSFGWSGPGCQAAFELESGDGDARGDRVTLFGFRSPLDCVGGTQQLVERVESFRTHRRQARLVLTGERRGVMLPLCALVMGALIVGLWWLNTYWLFDFDAVRREVSVVRQRLLLPREDVIRLPLEKVRGTVEQGVGPITAIWLEIEDVDPIWMGLCVPPGQSPEDIAEAIRVFLGPSVL